jgi:F0F1-type ATP synthase delta subunit
MTTTLEQLLAKYPKAVKAIGIADYKQRDRLRVIIRIKDYAYANSIGDHAMDSVADLLAAIEAHITATEPLSDEAIEAMKWHMRRPLRSLAEVGLEWMESSHNADIDRLHAEIKRLRKEKPDAR